MEELLERDIQKFRGLEKNSVAMQKSLWRKKTTRNRGANDETAQRPMKLSRFYARSIVAWRQKSFRFGNGRIPIAIVLQSLYFLIPSGCNSSCLQALKARSSLQNLPKCGADKNGVVCLTNHGSAYLIGQRHRSRYR